MRSIRRSLLGYLLLLLAVALGAVGMLVDRFTHGAIASRERSEVDSIENAFRVRRIEAQAQFDADLLREAKTLAGVVRTGTGDLLGQNPDRRSTPEQRAAQFLAWASLGFAGPPPDVRLRPGLRFGELPPLVRPTEAEVREFRARVVSAELANTPDALPFALGLAALGPRLPVGDLRQIPPAAFNDPRQYNPYPGWVEYELPRLDARVREALHKKFEDDDHPGCTQLAVATGPPGRLSAGDPIRLGTDRVELPFDPGWLAHEDGEPRFDDVPAPGGGSYRRVVASAT
ncbi:MAG: hypothetical protein K2V38_12260, partial [Gemmataceae bacterium]|nr:hypothetical protein [Gemmataceae bacterium]